MDVAILQSNYIPWKGYFDLIASVDVFVFHDDLQYTKNDWRNRNKIKTDKGSEWLTVPCGSNEKRLICEVALKDSDWQRKHWNMICRHYGSAPFFDHYKDFFADFYLLNQWTNLSDMNQYLIRKIASEILDLKVRFLDSRVYNLTEKKSKRVLELLKKIGAQRYLSGPAAKSYLDTQSLYDENIELLWMSYDNYPEYQQQYEPFEHAVSILDLLFNVGPEFAAYMRASSK